MTVIVEESVCFDCNGKSTCQRLKRLNPGKSIRNEIEDLYDKVKSGEIDTSAFLCKMNGEYRKRGKEVFEVHIVTCSMKVQYNDRERLAKEAIDNPKVIESQRDLIYCTICKKMHISGSGIGLEHQKIMDKNKEMNKDGKKLEPERRSKNSLQTT